MTIFLDCDGVINQLQPNYYIDEDCVKALKKIVDKFDAQIVLISTWRLGYCHDYNRCTPQIKHLIDVFKKYGLAIYNRTKNFDNRSKEIDTYVKEHNIDKYIILDDDKSIYENTKNLYIVDAKTGLTTKDVKRIVKY